MELIKDLRCRNCECYHATEGNELMFTHAGSFYALGSPSSVCETCTHLSKFENSALGCCKYEPRGNLEYLAYKYEKSLKHE